MKRHNARRKGTKNPQDVGVVFMQMVRLVDTILGILEKGLKTSFSPFKKIYNILYKRYFHKGFEKIENEDRVLLGFLLSVLVLMIVGVMNAYSLKNVVSSPTAPFYKTLFFKHILYLVVSSLLGFFVYKKIPYSFWGNKKIVTIIYFGVVAGLLAVLMFGDCINGARRWINLKIMSIQPSEFAKLVAILVAGRWIKEQKRLRKKIRIVWIEDAPEFIKIKTNNLISKNIYVSMGLFPAMVLGVITYAQPDFGTAALICGFPLIMLLLSSNSMSEVVRMIGVAVLGALVIAILAPYRLRRLMILMDPWSAAQGDGYQTTQSIAAVGSGHIWGFNNNLLHLFNSGISKYAFLPECHTDFAFAVWSQEHGFIGSLVVFLAVAGIMYYGFCIGQQCRETFGIITAYGITLMIGLQAIYNMFMVGGFTPVVGVPLPFVSYGGSAMAMNVWGVAILASIAKANRRRKAIRKARIEAERSLMRDEVQHRYRPNN